MPPEDERLNPYLVHIGNCGAIDHHEHPAGEMPLTGHPMVDPVDARCICGLREAYLALQADIVEWKRVKAICWDK